MAFYLGINSASFCPVAAAGPTSGPAALRVAVAGAGLSRHHSVAVTSVELAGFAAPLTALVVCIGSSWPRSFVVVALLRGPWTTGSFEAGGVAVVVLIRRGRRVRCILAATVGCVAAPAAASRAQETRRRWSRVRRGRSAGQHVVGVPGRDPGLADAFNPGAFSL